MVPKRPASAGGGRLSVMPELSSYPEPPLPHNEQGYSINSRFSTAPSPRPQSTVTPSGKQFADVRRYTLVDSGSGYPSSMTPPPIPASASASNGAPRRTQSPARRTQSPARTTANGNVAGVGAGRKPATLAVDPQSALEVEEELPPASARPGNGPATFAEMGFQGARAEEKECVIM